MIDMHSMESELSAYAGPSIPAEQQLAEIEACGLVLNEGVTLESLFDDFTNRAEIESQPYLRLVERMAGWTTDGAARPACPRLWMDDTECIYDPDAYAQIVQRLNLLSSGKPQIENLSGGMDDDAQTAWVKFEIDGLPILWEFGMDGDWLNTEVFEKYSDMLADTTGERIYFVTPSELGQEFIVACLSDEQAAKFGSLPHIRIAKITSGNQLVGEDEE